MTQVLESGKVQFITGGISIDDRGSVSFINDFDPLSYGVRRSYIVKNHNKGFRRAFHFHWKESKFVRVIQGNVLFAVITPDIKKGDYSTDVIGPAKIDFRGVLSEYKPGVLYIPPAKANGFMTLSDNAIIEFYSTSTTEESLKDDIRLPVDEVAEVWKIEER
jgi:dTDP-4-dehydrorhamnose 3,5-epimerase-like enzyme